jgi:hypothetical protein
MKFYNGLKQDTAHIDQPQDSYRRARNIILDHTTFSVRTEGDLSNLNAADSNYRLGVTSELIGITICGFINLPQDVQLAILRRSDGTHDIVRIASNVYTHLGNVSGFGWHHDYPIKGVAYEDARGDTVVVWTDGENRPVYLKINAATTSVAATDIIDLFPEVEYPNAVALPVAGNQAGEIENGTYTFFIAYEVDDDNLTPFSPSYGAFKVGHGIAEKEINTQIGLRFDGLDTSYAWYRIYVIHNRNEVLNSYYVGRQTTDDSTFVWSGNIISSDVTVDQLTIPPGWYTKAETLTVLDDRLYMANVERDDVYDFSSFVNNITLHWSIDGSSKWDGAPESDDTKSKNWGAAYHNFLVNNLDDQVTPANPDHYGMSMGFMPGCAYAFYIAFLLKDGTWTRAYHIPAGSPGAATVENPAGGQSFPTLPGGNDLYHGRLGSVSNGNGSNLHVMPEPSQIADVWDHNYYGGVDGHVSNRWAMTDVGVGAKFSTALTAEQQEHIQGYSLFYAKGTANSRTVLGYVPYLESNGYLSATEAYSGDYLVAYDSYLLANKPRLNNFSLEVIYSGITGQGYYSPTGTTNEITNFDFEYLEGNQNGIDFINDNRENRLCISRTAGADTLDNQYDTTYPLEVKGTGDEGSQLKFGTDAKGPNYLTELSDTAFMKLHRDTPTEWYTDLDNQELCACSYIEKNLTQLGMSKVSWGGDAVAHAVRFRRITSTNDPVNDGVGQEVVGPDTKTLSVDTRSYFTWTYGLQQYEDLTDPTVLTEEQIELYKPAGSGLEYAGAPEVMNPAALPVHTYRRNDYKGGYTTSQDDPVFNFPNRIIRSAKQNYESHAIRWRTFAIADYYDNALNKGPVQNIESYAGELIIHHTDGIFKTIGKETLDTSASAIFVGSGDIFRAPPQELLPTEEGYAGLTKHTDAALTKGGYIFVDSAAGKVFKLDSQLADISQKGMRRYFRERFRVDDTITHSPYAYNGYAIGYDPVFDRILFTAVQGQDAEDNPIFQTISYSLMNDCWASNHDYVSLAYQTNRTGLILFNGVRFRDTNVGDNTRGAFVEMIFNEGGSVPKTFQSFQWVTRDTEGEGLWTADTFDTAIVYNDRGCSGERPLANNVRWIEEAWNFNDFRNLVNEANLNEAYFDVDDELIATIDTNKPWYQQQRIRGGYAGLRLILGTSTGRTLYLSEALARFRVSHR